MTSLVAVSNASNNKTASTSWVIEPFDEVDVPKNCFSILSLVCDNAGTNGVASLTSDTITDSAGNTWTRVALINRTAGAANDGITIAVWTSPLPFGFQGATGTRTSFTFDFSVNTTAKAMRMWSFNDLRDHWVTFYSVTNSGRPGVITNNRRMAADDLVFFFYGFEGVGTFTADTDTNQGSWSSLYTSATSGGQGATNVTLAAQFKILTAPTTSQTWDTGSNSPLGDYAVLGMWFRNGTPYWGVVQ